MYLVHKNSRETHSPWQEPGSFGIILTEFGPLWAITIYLGLSTDRQVDTGVPGSTKDRKARENNTTWKGNPTNRPPVFYGRSRGPECSVTRVFWYRFRTSYPHHSLSRRVPSEKSSVCVCVCVWWGRTSKSQLKGSVTTVGLIERFYNLDTISDTIVFTIGGHRTSNTRELIPIWRISWLTPARVTECGH